MLLKYKIVIILALAILFIGSVVGSGWYAYNTAYDKGYQSGIDSASLTCQKERTQYEQERVRQEAQKAAIMEKIMAKIDELFALSKSLAVANIQRQDELKRDIEKLRKMSENKPLVVVKDGKCVLSKDFQDTYNSIISRGNQQ